MIVNRIAPSDLAHLREVIAKARRQRISREMAENLTAYMQKMRFEPKRIREYIGRNFEIERH